MIKADKVYYNGNIYTMNAPNDIVSGIVVYDGKIIATGNDDKVKSYESHEYIDLKGYTVLPGFADTHMHLYQSCIERLLVNLSDAHSIKEICNKLRSAVNNLKPNQWLFGENIHSDYLIENRFPNCKELDEISTTIPIIIGSFCRHTHILNSKAIEICKLNEIHESMPVDMFEYFKDGNLNGIIKEWAYDKCVVPNLPLNTLEQNIEYMDEYLKYVASFGITQLHAYQNDNPDGVMLYELLRRKKGLKCRITFNFFPDTQNETNITTGFGDNMLKIGATKFLIDGSIGSSSALMYDEYCDAPGEYGIMTHSQEELNNMVKKAYDKGNDIAIHAIGDKGNDMALTAFENCYDENIGWDRRFYIIHATLISKTFIERAKKLPILLCTQPIFIRNFVNMSKSKIGDERDKRFMAFRTMLDNGLIVSAGSDSPVREINPFNGIECAVTRKDIGGNEVISTNQEVSVYEAISMYTKNAAYCSHEENIKGTLSVGKVADMVIIDTNPFTCPINNLHKIKVLETIMGGKTTFKLYQKDTKMVQLL